MVDLYIDDISLTEIQTKGNGQILMFRNKGKDETVATPVSNAELLNVFSKGKNAVRNPKLDTYNEFRKGRCRQ